MFTTKQTQLIKQKPKVKKSSTVTSVYGKSASSCAFLNAGLKKSAQTLSGNGAAKFSNSGDSFVDQFAKLGTYKAPRSFADISTDADILWSEDPLLATKFSLYLRTISRKVQLPDGSVTEEPQKGGELKHEPIFRMIWLSQHAPETFWKNIGLFVAVGSWHDIFTMLQYDLIWNGWEHKVLDWNKFGDLILTALENSNTSELVKKYLPQIKANSACKTIESQANNILAKWICSLLFGNKENPSYYKAYRKIKSSGTAHEWQQLISKRNFDKIDFAKIHGRALNLLVRSKFLFNQKLSDKYAAWVKRDDVKVKYTGFVHELFSNLPETKSKLAQHEQDTINKQFETLVEKGKSEKDEKQTNFICVRDISHSMSATATGTNMSCFNIGKALALYFSEFLTGRFANSFINFDNNAEMKQWKGSTPIDKWYNDHSSCVGGTNFQSVINLFAQIKRQGVHESDFPTGILCISDSEFNPTQLEQTNVEAARTTLRNAGFSKEFVSKFQIVLWNLQSSYYGKGTGEKFETFNNESGTYYFSGYSPSVINFLTNNKVLNARELFDAAMDQQILNLIEI